VPAYLTIIISWTYNIREVKLKMFNSNEREGIHKAHRESEHREFPILIV
jgi:hypothetical protein